MNSTQRTATRTALLNAGFTRTNYTPDLTGVGDYTETFTHPDGDFVTIQWSPRTEEAPALDSDDENLAEHTDATRTRHQHLLDMVTSAPDLSEHVVIISASNPTDDHEQDN